MAQAPAPVDAPGTGSALPQLDPMLALGTLSEAITALDRWQRADPGVESDLAEAQAASDESQVPLNRIPMISAAIGDKAINSPEKITMDVIGLLFDYIFRDPSIPESLRGLFTRLQVPILKTALLDRSFFSDKKHPARRLLDHLAAASIGATTDSGYGAALELVATRVIDELCRDFKVDVAAFVGADAKLQEFVDGEQRKLAASLNTEVAGVFAAEEDDADRSHVRAFIRDELSGVNVPFDVRSFSETTWADYLTLLRAQHGTESAAWRVCLAAALSRAPEMTKAGPTLSAPALLRTYFELRPSNFLLEHVQQPRHRIVEPAHHALLQRDDAVVRDVNVLRTDLRAALRDVAVADPVLVLQVLEPIR